MNRTVGGALLLGGLALVSLGAWRQMTNTTVVVSNPIVSTSTTPTTATNSATSISTSAEDEPDFSAVEDGAVRDPDERLVPRNATIEVLESFSHDPMAYTQGLELFDGRLFETTGLYGESTLREVDLASGGVNRRIDLDPDLFGEGMTVVDDDIVLITWRSGEAFRYRRDTFELVDTYAYDGEGWGLCDDEEYLWMSNGSDQLTRRDRDSFETIDQISVTLSGAPVDQINELECVDGMIWANVWQTPLILEIDPQSGVVQSVLDASELRPDGVADDGDAVLNGIAFDPTTDTFLIGGKLWPSLYRVRIS